MAKNYKKERIYELAFLEKIEYMDVYDSKVESNTGKLKVDLLSKRRLPDVAILVYEDDDREMLDDND